MVYGREINSADEEESSTARTLTVVDDLLDSMGENGVIYANPYSGVDIKLVVHLPPADPSEIQHQIQQLREELTRLELMRAGASTTEQLREVLSNLDPLILGNPDYSPVPAAVENVAAHMAEALLSQIEELQHQSEASQGRTKVLAEVQTFSWSTHREKYQYRPLGSVYPRTILRGPRTISGSMVFTVFNQHMLHEFFGNAGYRSTGVGDWDTDRWTSFTTDQLPPLDMSIIFANEYGNLSWMSLLGLEFVNEGGVMSIEDLFMEGTATWIARDMDHIRSVANRPMTRTHGVGSNLTGTQLLTRDLTFRIWNRRNPFI